MKLTRQLILSTLTLFFAMTFSLNAQERQTTEVVKEDAIEKIKDNTETKTVPKKDPAATADIKKYSSQTLKTDSKAPAVSPEHTNTPTAAEIKKHSSKTLKKGSKGEAVKSTQESLNRGAAIGSTNKKDKEGLKESVASQKGKTGTKKAVQAYQKKKKLDADGIAGSKTISKADKKKMKAKKAPKQKKKKDQLRKDQ